MTIRYDTQLYLHAFIPNKEMTGCIFCLLACRSVFSKLATKIKNNIRPDDMSYLISFFFASFIKNAMNFSSCRFIQEMKLVKQQKYRRKERGKKTVIYQHSCLPSRLGNCIRRLLLVCAKLWRCCKSLNSFRRHLFSQKRVKVFLQPSINSFKYDSNVFYTLKT